MKIKLSEDYNEIWKIVADNHEVSRHKILEHALKAYLDQSLYSPDEQALHREWWIEALRSGKYKQHSPQTDSRLLLVNYDDSGETWSALGVACDVSNMGNWLSLPQCKLELKEWDYSVGLKIYDRSLPAEVMHFYGLSDQAGGYTLVEQVKALPPTISDISGRKLPGFESYSYESIFEAQRDRLDFDTIADIIESEPPGLFKTI